MVQTGPHHILSNASDQTHLSLMGKTLELAPAASELPGCYVAVSCRAASPWVQAAHTLLRKCLPCPATEAPARSGPLRRLPPALSRCAEDRAVGGLGLQPPQAQQHPGLVRLVATLGSGRSLGWASSTTAWCSRLLLPSAAAAANGDRGPAREGLAPSRRTCPRLAAYRTLEERQTRFLSGGRPGRRLPCSGDVTRVSGSTMLHAGDPPAPPEWGTEHPGVSSASSVPTTASLWSRHVTQLSGGPTSRQKSLAEQ